MDILRQFLIGFGIIVLMGIVATLYYDKIITKISFCMIIGNGLLISSYTTFFYYIGTILPPDNTMVGIFYGIIFMISSVPLLLVLFRIADLVKELTEKSIKKSLQIHLVIMG